MSNKTQTTKKISHVVLIFILSITLLTLGITKTKAESNSWVNSGLNMYSNVIGNIGIDSTNPNFKLTFGSSGPVVGMENSSSFVARNTYGVYEDFLWPRESNNASYLQYGDGGFYLRNNSMRNTLYLSNTNSVGIGTINPDYKFTVGGNGSIFGVDNTANFVAKNPNGTYETYLWPRESNNAMYMQSGAGGFYLRNNNSQNKFTIDSQNNICIGNC